LNKEYILLCEEKDLIWSNLFKFAAVLYLFLLQLVY